MRIFLSHSSKDKNVVIKFTEFLESLTTDIDVFCSSQAGSIGIGNNYIEKIISELNTCDIFIPVVSQNYYDSKFSMMELGFAYAILHNTHSDYENYIYPFCIAPVKKEEALSGTPLASLQTAEINSTADIRSFIEGLKNYSVTLRGLINRSIHSFVFNINQIISRSMDILHTARIEAYCSDNVPIKDNVDYISYSLMGNEITVNYNLLPYGTNLSMPNFLSLVVKYVDKIDLNIYLQLNESAQFTFVLNNYANSLKSIHIEFKHSDNNRILNTYKCLLKTGENCISLSLEDMKSEALANIAEICFVIHPDDLNEGNENKMGMFKIDNISCI